MLDIVVIAIVVLFTLYGVKAGLTRMVLRVGSVLLSIALAWMLYPVISKLLAGFMFDSISELIRQNYIEPKMSGMLGGMETLPDFIRSAVQSSAQSAAQSASSAMAESVTTLILNIAAFLITFILSRVIIMLLARVSDLICRLPIIKQFNKLGGGALGLVEGVIAVYMILALAFLIAPVRDSDVFHRQLNASPVTNMIYSDNIIIKLVTPDVNNKV